MDLMIRAAKDPERAVGKTHFPYYMPRRNPEEDSFRAKTSGIFSFLAFRFFVCLFKYLFVCLAMLSLSCGMWDLVP